MAPAIHQHSDLPVPAPTSWRTLQTDTPVLRNERWEGLRSIPRGIWTIAVLAGRSAFQPIAMQDYVVDDFGALAELSQEAGVANAAWYASTYAIDQAACEWMDQFTAPLQAGSALKAMHDTAKASRLQQQDEVQAITLPEPRYAGHAATVLVQDDPHWRSGQPLYSVLLEHDVDRLVLTQRQVRALANTLQGLL